ncbi:MAG: hypothetical protein NVS3B21_31040 [Acidimicrobiales bacterium]
MVGRVAEPVVRVEKDFLDKATDMASASCVDVLAPFAPDLDEPGETKLGQMLTCGRGGGPSEPRERSNVALGGCEQPKDPKPGVIGQQAERHNCHRHLVVSRLIDCDRCDCLI